MAVFNGVIYSHALNMDTNINVILPQDTRPHLGLDPLNPGIVASAAPKTLILLHGLTDNCGAWLYRTSILRYAEKYDLTVVMPEVQKSFYLDLTYGSNYFSYVTDELPQLMSKLFHTNVDSKHLMIAGLSMGGYGALLAGLTYPDRYLGVGAFSSACNIGEIVSPAFANRKETIGWEKEQIALFGKDAKIPDYADLQKLAHKSAFAVKKPPFYMACGTSDALLPANRSFRDTLQTLGYDVQYEEWEGVHEWGFWDTAIQKMLQYHLSAGDCEK